MVVGDVARDDSGLSEPDGIFRISGRNQEMAARYQAGETLAAIGVSGLAKI
jgi:hypothetical protein